MERVSEPVMNTYTYIFFFHIFQLFWGRPYTCIYTLARAAIIVRKQRHVPSLTTVRLRGVERLSLLLIARF